MIKLEEFINTINEGRKPKDAGELDKDNLLVVDPKNKKEIVNADDVHSSQIKGKPAESNGTKGTYAIDEADPKDFKKLTPDEEDELSENNYTIYDRMMDKKDFMVIGLAGWAKTAIIKRMAKMCGRSVITVYLDKAVATDLGGIPVPAERDGGSLEQKVAVPSWVIPLIERPNDKFLLFFDELNQAQPDVMNALMPIILDHVICGYKFDNFIVGAAGNEMEENEGGLTDINSNKALKARLAPMKWHTHDDESWRDAFDYLHKKFDKILGKEVINKTYEMRNYLSAPRDIERWVFEQFQEKLAEGRHIRPSKLKEMIMEHCIWDRLDDATKTSRTFEKMINEYVDYAANYVATHGNEQKAAEAEEGGSRRNAKGTDQVNGDDKAAIMKALEQGYFFNSKANDPDNGDDNKYVCTVENCITEIFDPSITGITAEIFRKILKEMDAAGKKPKYQSVADAKEDIKKHGLIDPSTVEGFLVHTHIFKDVDAPEPRRNTRNR